jgi:hypothetical protein
MLMFAVIPKPYEAFRGCFFTTGNNSPREAYIFLPLEAGESVEQTDVSCRCLYLSSGNDFDGDQHLQIMFVFVLVKLFVILNLLINMVVWASYAL